MIRRLAVVTLLALAACAPKPETPEQMTARMKAESDSARTAIEAANAHWVRYAAAGRADSAALDFAEDAVFMTANAPSLRGRPAIQAMFSEMFSYGTWQVTLTTTRVDAYGPIAVEQGTNILRFTPGPHAPAGMAAMYPDTGKYLTYWKKVNGTWLEAVDISNSDRAMPAPAAKRH
ncbi:MAG: nuclear transport factor 2 family protein [Gemmatimonadales bacterium]|jgi:ketosteroid isomerase-like protein